MNPGEKSRVDAVIFDFGGVILDVDYDATTRAMRALLGEKAHLIYTQSEQSVLFDQLEIGQISPETFYRRLIASAETPVTREAIDTAWNAILGETRPERLQFLKRVARHRRSFLLSNTNAIHKKAFDPRLSRWLGSENFDSLFEKAYYSHLMGLRKPSPEIYRYIVRRHGLKAEHTLFIDDSEQNIRGAEAAGLQTYLLKGELLDAPLSFLAEA